MLEVNDFRKEPIIVANKALESKCLKNWAKEERPREKLMQLGRRNLTNAELLAILIGSGTPNRNALDLARFILADNAYSLQKIAQLGVEELCQYEGIGQAKAIFILAAMELALRKDCESAQDMPKVTQAKEVFQLMRMYFTDLTHEEFWVVFTDHKHRVLKKYMASSGGAWSTVVDLRKIARKALAVKAENMWVMHNHPSGMATPSRQDIDLTESLANTCQTIGVPLMDHIIFAEKTFYSFKDSGRLTH